MNNYEKIQLLDLNGILHQKIDDDKYEIIKDTIVKPNHTKLIDIIDSLDLSRFKDINDLLLYITLSIDEKLEILKSFYNECTWSNIINRIKENLNIEISSKKEKNITKKLVEIEKIIQELYFSDVKLDDWSK